MFQKVLGNHGGVWARERPQQACCIGHCDWDMPGGSARPGHLVSVLEATSFFEACLSARPRIRPRSEGGEWGVSFRPGAREPLCLSVPAPRPDSAAPGSMVLSKEPPRGASGWCCPGREQAACPQELLASQPPSSPAWPAAAPPALASPGTGPLWVVPRAVDSPGPLSAPPQPPYKMLVLPGNPCSFPGL